VAGAECQVGGRQAVQAAEASHSTIVQAQVADSAGRQPCSQVPPPLTMSEKVKRNRLIRGGSVAQVKSRCE